MGSFWREGVARTVNKPIPEPVINGESVDDAAVLGSSFGTGRVRGL